MLQDGDGGGGASRSVFIDDGMLLDSLDPDGWKRDGKPVDRGRKSNIFEKTGPDMGAFTRGFKDLSCITASGLESHLDS